MNSPNALKGKVADILPPRRAFFSRVFSGLAALGLSGLVTPAWAQNTPPPPQNTPPQNRPPQNMPVQRLIPKEDDMKDWPGQLKDRRAMLIDMLGPSNGDGFIFAHHYLREAKNSAVVVMLRGKAVPLALNHFAWKVYKIGEQYKIIDPETKEPAVKNPFFEMKPGVMRNDEAAMDVLLKGGVVFGVCALTLAVISRELATNIGVTQRDATQELFANLIPGIWAVPSGPWGVHRAQEAGCTYCFGGI